MNHSGAAQISSTPRHWTARLDLEFAHRAGRTRLDHNCHHGPLRVQRLFHPEPNGKAHCYLLHPPGGVVLGDELHIGARVRSGAALLTTPSAGRFYSVGDHREMQRQSVQLEVRDGRLEWLPQETILFSGANARLDTRIDLEDGAALAFWDVLVLGRPACGEGFGRGSLQQRLTLNRCGRPLLCERLALRAGDRMSAATIGLNGASTLGIALFTDTLTHDAAGDWLATVNGARGHGPFSITQRADLLVARYRGDDAFSCREGFVELWQRLGHRRDGKPPQSPRIWHT